MTTIINSYITPNEKYFSCATTVGYKIYKLSPIREIFNFEFHGSLSIAKLLNSTNILICVGGRNESVSYKNAKYLFIWDLKNLCEINSKICSQPICDICITYKHIVVNYQDHIEVLNLNSLNQITKFKTRLNPIVHLQLLQNESTLLFTNFKKGYISIWKRKKMIEYKTNLEKIFGLYLNENNSKFITVSSKYIKSYDLNSLELLNCISIKSFTSSSIINVSSDKNLRYVIIQFKDEHIIIFDIENNIHWNIIIPDVTSCFVLNHHVPHVFIISELKMYNIKLKKNNSFIIVKNKCI